MFEIMARLGTISTVKGIEITCIVDNNGTFDILSAVTDDQVKKILLKNLIQLGKILLYVKGKWVL